MGSKLVQSVRSVGVALATLLAANALTGCAGFFISTHSSTVLTSSVSTALVGATITLNSVVTPSTATGTVTYYDGSTSLGTGTLSSGSASLTNSTLTAGTHSLTADYGGDSNYNGSNSAAVTVVINSALTATTTTLTASPTTQNSGSVVTLTATIAPTAATGTVTFANGGTTIGTANVAVGVATFAWTPTTTGSASLTATYSGDTTYAASTSTAITETVQ